MRARGLIFLGIVVALTGCDNVTWGGVSFQMETSADRLARMEGTIPAQTPEEPQAQAAPDPELGPLVLIGRPSGGDVVLSLVGQLVDGAIAATPTDEMGRRIVAERLSAGGRFTLFSEGTRVGTAVVEASRLSDRYCSARPEIVTTAELVPQAIDAQQFIAIEGEALDSEYTGYTDPQHNYDQRVASLAMMRELVPQVGAVWPESTLDIRRDVQVFRRPDADEPTIAATFVYQDDLSLGAAPADAYSVFIVGDMGPNGYRPSFATYRRYGEDGKAAARFFDHLDWDGDGVSELVLEVFGENGLWTSILDRTDSGWTEVHHDACGLPLPRSAGTS